LNFGLSLVFAAMLDKLVADKLVAGDKVVFAADKVGYVLIVLSIEKPNKSLFDQF
jgi:hypothetical protein